MEKFFLEAETELMPESADSIQTAVVIQVFEPMGCYLLLWGHSVSSLLLHCKQTGKFLQQDRLIMERMGIGHWLDIRVMYLLLSIQFQTLLSMKVIPTQLMVHLPILTQHPGLQP